MPAPAPSSAMIPAGPRHSRGRASPAGRSRRCATGRRGRARTTAPERDHAIASTTTTPPDTIATVTATALARAPARRSPSRGPPATTTMKTPCIRPRISSGAASCSIDERSTALTMSPAPATARNSTASHSESRQAEADDRHAPHRDRASTTAPCRSTRDTQPEVSPMSSAPMETPANSQPSAFGESVNRVSDSSGKTACGQAKHMAMTSTTKVMSSTGWVRRKAKPSPTPRIAAPSRSGPASRPAAATAARAAAARRRGSPARRRRRRGTARPPR